MLSSHSLQEGENEAQQWKGVEQLFWPWLMCKRAGKPQGTLAVAPAGEQVHLCSLSRSPVDIRHCGTVVAPHQHMFALYKGFEMLEDQHYCLQL